MCLMNLSLAAKSIRIKWIAAAALLIAVATAFIARQPADPEEQTHRVTREDFLLWSVFEGTIQAERMSPVYSQISQPSAILFLAPEGSMVGAGDVVAELDRSSLDQSLATLERDHALAETELDTLLRATIPSEQAAAANELDTLRYDEQKQRRIVANTEQLHASGLVSDSELEGHRILLGNLERKIAFQENRLTNLKEIIHPAAEAKARAQREAARRQLDAVKEQFESARITAPFAGMVVYLPLHIDGEYRNVREGDTVFRNQKIMQIADMESLVVHCQVPESGLALVQTGKIAVITPGAFPRVKLRGEVESVGSVAVSVSGKPSWQKFFNVMIRLHDIDDRLRSSMSATVQILSHEEPHALVVPRAFVGWEQGEPWCMKKINGTIQPHPVTLGPGNERAFVVVQGLEEDERIYHPGRAP